MGACKEVLRVRCCRQAIVWALGAGMLAGCQSSYPEVVYVAFGDSSTRGPSEMDYVDYLPDLMNLPEEQWFNEGDGGEVTAEGLVRLQMLLDSEFFPNAQVLLFWEGGNDLIDMVAAVDPLLLSDPSSASFRFRDEIEMLLDEIQGNLENAIQVARDAGWQVFVATYFFLPEFSTNCDPLLLDLLLPAQSANANRYTIMLNERIRLATANQGATLVDVATLDDVLRSDSDYYENCNHLSAQGNAVVAQLFADVILANRD